MVPGSRRFDAACLAPAEAGGKPLCAGRDVKIVLRIVNSVTGTLTSVTLAPRNIG